jgi:hypothetical protein
MARWDLSEELETIWNRWLLPLENEKKTMMAGVFAEIRAGDFWRDSYIRVSGHYSIITKKEPACLYITFCLLGC